MGIRKYAKELRYDMNNKTQNTLPLGAVKPQGWLLNQLRIQAEGLTGYLEGLWDSVGSYSGWLGGTGESWERGPYYCDGLVPLAYLLEDKKMIEKSQKWIDWTLNSQMEDGNFGPRNNDDWWPRMVMLKVLVQYYEVTQDKRVLPFMSKYFRFQKEVIKEKPLESWGQARGGDLIYCIHWLYDQTKDETLLELANIIHGQTLNWTRIFNHFPFTMPTSFYYDWDPQTFAVPGNIKQYHATHIVNVVMGLKEPGLFYRQSMNDENKEAVFHGIDSLTKYHGFVNGLFSGDEHLSGNNPTQGSELCSVVEYMFSLQTLLEVLDDIRLADALEKVAYNALPAAITKDFRSHQYDQQPNQILVSRGKRNWFNNNDEANLFGLKPHYGCCLANMHQGWPKFVKSFWYSTVGDGLTAMVYAPCTVKATVGNDVEVAIDEETEYPFDEVVKMRFRCSRNVKFPLKLRIPGWCEKATVCINGSPYGEFAGGGYAAVNREWKNGDTLVLELPMKIRTSSWYNNSVGIERGPLVFALRIGAKWEKIRGNEKDAYWEIHPTTPWNYALELDLKHPDSCFETIRGNISRQPFDTSNPPLLLKAKGRRLKDWKMEGNSAGDLPDSPIKCNAELENIELIPYGAAKLRISQFPYIENNKDECSVIDPTET
jgi:hypothetical protein